MANLLLPIYNYVEMLEKDNTCLWQVEPAFQCLIQELVSRGTFYQLEKEAQLLAQCLENRNRVTSKRELIITAYFLTPIGYYHIQNLKSPNSHQGATGATKSPNDSSIVWAKDAERGLIPSFFFDEIDLPSNIPLPSSDWDENLYHSVETRHSSSFSSDKFIQGENNLSNSDQSSDSDSDLDLDPNTDSDSDTDLDHNLDQELDAGSDPNLGFICDFEKAKEIANDKWLQFKSIQIENVGKVIMMLQEFGANDTNDHTAVKDFFSIWKETLTLFFNNLSNLIHHMQHNYGLITNICKGTPYIHMDSHDNTQNNDLDENAQSNDLDENAQSNDLDENTQNNDSNEITVEKILEILSYLDDMIKSETLPDPIFVIIVKISRIIIPALQQYNNSIACFELHFIKQIRKQNIFVLNQFNKDDSLISINEQLIRYCDGLIHLKNPILDMMRDIINIAKGKLHTKGNLWEGVTSINDSSSYMVIAHYVVTELGRLLDPNQVGTLSKLFNEWVPGNSNDYLEHQVFKMYQFSPVDYWNELLKSTKWTFLSQIALRIISIPPTEAACERVFSARREIMNKHVSNIRDSVVEARAHLKAGLYHQKK